MNTFFANEGSTHTQTYKIVRGQNYTQKRKKLHRTNYTKLKTKLKAVLNYYSTFKFTKNSIKTDTATCIDSIIVKQFLN